MSRPAGWGAGWRAWCARLVVVLAAGGATLATGAEKEAKEPPKPEPPGVAIVLPVAVSAGGTNVVQVRGRNLTNATELRFTNDSFRPVLAIRSKGKADVPKDADARKVGDTRIELELVLAANAEAGTNHFVVVSPSGTSEPWPLIVVPSGRWLTEREPNGGFQQAQTLGVGQILSGVIQEAGDVDVFRFSGRRGQRVRLEVRAAGLGSTLDSILSLLDASGHFLATQDDTGAGRDSSIEATLPKDGDYLISVVDAHERGSVTHAYLLSVQAVQ